jgi:ArsR family transcriptional regulator
MSTQNNPNNFQEIANFLRILAEENRLKIFHLLKGGERKYSKNPSCEDKSELCVCDIWQDLDLPQNLVSHHLKVLRDAQLVNIRKDGLKVYYSLNYEELEKWKNLLINFLTCYGDK